MKFLHCAVSRIQIFLGMIQVFIIFNLIIWSNKVVSFSHKKNYVWSKSSKFNQILDKFYPQKIILKTRHKFKYFTKKISQKISSNFTKFFLFSCNVEIFSRKKCRDWFTKKWTLKKFREIEIHTNLRDISWNQWTVRKIKKFTLT